MLRKLILSSQASEENPVDVLASSWCSNARSLCRDNERTGVTGVRGGSEVPFGVDPGIGEWVDDVVVLSYSSGNKRLTVMMADKLQKDTCAPRTAPNPRRKEMSWEAGTAGGAAFQALIARSGKDAKSGVFTRQETSKSSARAPTLLHNGIHSD